MTNALQYQSLVRPQNKMKMRVSKISNYTGQRKHVQEKPKHENTVKTARISVRATGYNCGNTTSQNSSDNLLSTRQSPWF